MFVLEWLNNQLLRMEWLSTLVTFLVEQGLGLSVKENLGGSIHFFIYDVVKIFILLSVLIFAISYVQSFFPPERTRKILGRFNGLSANILAALLGTVTPFVPVLRFLCSSALPTQDCQSASLFRFSFPLHWLTWPLSFCLPASLTGRLRLPMSLSG